MSEYFYFINGKSEEVEIEKYTRGGTKSPTSIYIIFNNKRYTPYEIKKYGITADLKRTFNAFLKKYYPVKMLRRVLQNENYLLNKIEKYDSWTGGLIPVPINIKLDKGPVAKL